MIGSILISLTLIEETTLKGFGGEALHGLLFDTLKGKSSDLASTLHNLKGQKPFSLSPPLESYLLKQGYCVIPKESPVTFKIALLDEELLATTISAFFTAMAEGTTLTLSQKPVIVRSVSIKEGEFVSFTSFPMLLSQASQNQNITLEFSTPTSFKSEGIQVMFPEPKLVFSSYLNHWNAFSKIKLSQEIKEAFPSIKVSNYHLRTELVHFSNYKIIGCKGRIEYRLPPKLSPSVCQALNALADFAFYCGTGAKTTMGMGQTRRIK